MNFLQQYISDEKPITAKSIHDELHRIQRRRSFRAIFKSGTMILAFVAAVAIIITLAFFPVLKVNGTSMQPSLYQGEVVIARKTKHFETGDICSFNYDNKQLIKRVIAGPGDWVFIDQLGNVYVNDVLLDEPYVSNKSLGINDLEYPYQVPEGRVFVLGDQRSVSVDSRSNEIGPVPIEDIAGKVLWRLWPLSRTSIVE